jgi:septal ring factor EnvC (AmiA/AmiB activator)
MTTPIRVVVRRAMVIVAVVLSLTVGAMAVQAAAVWTESSAPLTVAPVSASTLVQRLSDEQARAAALEDQISALTEQTSQLTAALRTATDRIARDATTAKTLRDKLAAAKKKLSALTAGGR